MHRKANAGQDRRGWALCSLEGVCKQGHPYPDKLRETRISLVMGRLRSAAPDEAVSAASADRMAPGQAVDEGQGPWCEPPVRGGAL